MSEEILQELKKTAADLSQGSNPKSFCDYIQEGKRLSDGRKVNKVFSRSSDYVIYSLKNDISIHYKTARNDQRTNTYLQQLDSLKTKAHIKFKGIQFDRINPFILAAMRAIFGAYSSDDIDNVTLPRKLCWPKVEISGFTQPPETAVWRSQPASNCSANYGGETRCNRFATLRS